MGPFRCNFFSDLDEDAVGSVLVRREKKPNREVLLGLGAGVGKVFARFFSASLWASGVDPLVGTRDAGENTEVTLGFVDGLLDCGFDGIPNRPLAFGT